MESLKKCILLDMKAREELPNDTVELKGLVYQLLDVVEEQKKLIANQNERIETQFQKIEEQSQKIDEQSHRIDQLMDQVNTLKRYRYGKKSEKVKKEKVEPKNQQETQEASLDANQQSKGSTKLAKFSKFINWKQLGTKLEHTIRSGKMAIPPYPSLSLFKALVLQRLYDLSDPQMEEMLYDRLSFRLFSDFGLSDKLPDETTICKFRGVLGKKVDILLEIVLQYL